MFSSYENFAATLCRIFFLLEKEIAGIPDRTEDQQFNESQSSREKEFNQTSFRTKAKQKEKRKSYQRVTGRKAKFKE